MPGAGAGLEPGDKLPFCYGMDARQRYWSFEDQAGRPAVFVLAGDAPPADTAALVEALAAHAAVFAARGAVLRLLARACAPGWATAEPVEGIELAHVMSPELFEAVGGGPCVLVADRALRLLVRLDACTPQATVSDALAALDALPVEPARTVCNPAPVLVVPGVLDADACTRLIARFEGGDHRPGAVSSVDAAGAASRRVDEDKKRRRDIELDPAEPLHAEVLAAISTRLVPEIAKAFHARVAHLDRILLARYDDTGGWFRRHRDNSSAHLAYREFAVTLNLNTGAYDGGELLFPEYNDHRHAPPAGGALVFSASLLHEALPVTRGSRYVLLAFLHSDAAEARRQAALSTIPQA